MMKGIFTVILSFTIGIAWSQSIVKPDIPADGVTYQIFVLDDQLNFSNQGDWDFSDIKTTSENSVQIAPISSSDIAKNYPNATHVKYDNGEQFFLGFNENNLTYNGEVTVITSSYPEPLVLHPYPFSLGNTNAKIVEEIPFTVAGGPPGLIRDDQVYSEVISSGTLTMPDKTVHQDAVLMKITRTFTDRQIGSPPCINKQEAHEWWVKGYAIPVVRTFNMVQSGACPSNVIRRSKFLKGDPLSIKAISAGEVLIFPNPVNTHLNIQVKKHFLNYNFSIIDITGRVVKYGVIESTNTRLDLKNLSKGVYNLALGNSPKQNFKFFKN